MSLEDNYQHPFWFGQFASSAFIWKYTVAKPAAIKHFRRTLHEQRLDTNALSKLNWSRTKELLEYAYHKVPFYRQRFKSIGLHPADITSPNHFSQVPVLTKQDIRNHFKELVSEDAKPRDLRLSTTGGSTGEPLKVYHQKQVVRSAMLWRMLLWWGLHPGLTYASVYRQQCSTLVQKLGNWLMNWPGRRVHLDAAELTPDTMNHFMGVMQRHKPKMLHGYVGAVDELASHILAHSIHLPPMKVIWVTSAPLNEVQRLRIEKAFGAPVCDQYGCCEVYWLAAQCPVRNGLHMMHDVRRIEFLDENYKPVSTGEFGQIAVTDFENRYFPFIRYLVGDRSRALSEKCECGLTLPLMDHVRGRITDMVRTPSGKSISGDYLTTIFDNTPDAVRQFQVFQAADYSLELRIVPNHSYTGLPLILKEVKQMLEKKLQGEVSIKMVQCDHIPHDRGKQRFVISEVVKKPISVG